MDGLLGIFSRLRESYPSEDEFFKNRPDVGGMATIDNQVIINPYSLLSSDEKSAVYENELARIKMRSPQFRPNFSLTKEQEDYLDSNDYKNASELDRKATIAARILTGDSTAQTPTSEQLNFVASKLKNVDGLLEVPATVGGLNATNYPNPYGLRAFPQKGGGYGGEMMPKTTGHMGLIEGLEKDEKGNPIYITEYSSGGDNGNFFYPTVFEGMTPEQVNTVKLLEAGKMKWSNPKAIELDKIAKQKGMERKSKGLSPFKDYN